MMITKGKAAVHWMAAGCGAGEVLGASPVESSHPEERARPEVPSWDTAWPSDMRVSPPLHEGDRRTSRSRQGGG